MGKRRSKQPQDLRLDPSKRLCPRFNDRSEAKYDLPDPEMGVRVVDNCAEEHMQ